MDTYVPYVRRASYSMYTSTLTTTCILNVAALSGVVIVFSLAFSTYSSNFSTVLYLLSTVGLCLIAAYIVFLFEFHAGVYTKRSGNFAINCQIDIFASTSVGI